TTFFYTRETSRPSREPRRTYAAKSAPRCCTRWGTISGSRKKNCAVSRAPASSPVVSSRTAPHSYRFHRDLDDVVDLRDLAHDEGLTVARPDHVAEMAGFRAHAGIDVGAGREEVLQFFGRGKLRGKTEDGFEFLFELGGDIHDKRRPDGGHVLGCINDFK